MAKGNSELRKQRVYSGESERDNRSYFQRDRDRILYTPALRRLSGVAQVVHASTERGYHNRLTHSLKVAQVGRRLAEKLIDETRNPEIDSAGGLNEDVVETACLAHDLGHPPFGHPAEEAIQNKLRDYDVTDSFEGNPQSFRIVNNVAIHKEPYGPEHKGLDLTLASLNAILKYPWQRGPSGKQSQKWGYYSTESAEFERVRELRTPGSKSDSMSLEAKIMDWADDLTYAIHDIADFYEAGLIPLDQLIRDTEERDDFVDAFEAEHDINSRKWDATTFLDKSLPQIAQIGAQGKMTNPLESPFGGSSTERASMSFMTSELIERYLGLDANVDVSVDSGIKGGLDVEPILVDEINLLHYLCTKYVFQDPALLAQQHGHRRLVKELFDILFDSTDAGSDYRGLLPSPFSEKVDLIHENSLGYDDIDKTTLRARVVADTIASMTEQQAMQLYERVSGHTPGLVTDRIL